MISYLKYSIIIPIYNRPEELEELLQSILNQSVQLTIEVVVVEDGSAISSKPIVEVYQSKLNLQYYFKENSGPGDSRNYGMQKATGDYFIIIDSDCVLPENYLKGVDASLQNNYTDAFGGADAAHPNFSIIQKAINYSMTSLFTTGGIRGSKNLKSKFQLRSFNMGLSKEAFTKTKGFSKQRFGEDIDLSFRLWRLGCTTQFIPKAFVYHKRRTTWRQFYNQTFNFGAARPILNKMHPTTAKITFWFPSLFLIGLILAILYYRFGNSWLINIYGIYFVIICLDSYVKNKNILVAITSVWSTIVQFTGYGLGFLRSIFRLTLLRQPKEQAFPKMFN